eukprot:7050403-Ditylum_brightwellii.AAC.1
MDLCRKDPTTSLEQVSGTKALCMPSGAKPVQAKVSTSKLGHHDGTPVINWWCKGLEVSLNLWARSHNEILDGGRGTHHCQHMHEKGLVTVLRYLIYGLGVGLYSQVATLKGGGVISMVSSG